MFVNHKEILRKALGVEKFKYNNILDIENLSDGPKNIHGILKRFSDRKIINMLK